MVNKSEERKDINTESKDNCRTCEDSYMEVSKMWEDSCLKLYKTWFESTEAFFGKVFEHSKDVSPETYKETFEKILVSAEESNKIYSSWIAELDENSRVTREVLLCEADPAKYKEVYDMWINSYGKMLNELLTFPLRQNMKEVFQTITGTPYINSEALEQISKIWTDSYTKFCLPCADSMLNLSLKSVQLSKGNVSPEAYKEFHTLWMNTYRDINGKLLDTQSTSKEVLEYFLQSENVNLNLGISKQGVYPQACREFYNLWGKMYGKAFDNFFDTAKIYAGKIHS